jgi:hypothetical protein
MGQIPSGQSVLNSGYISAQVISHNRQKLELWDVGKLPAEFIQAGDSRKKRSEQKLNSQYVHLAHNFHGSASSWSFSYALNEKGTIPPLE